jgi:hypothetical protein
VIRDDPQSIDPIDDCRGGATANICPPADEPDRYCILSETDEELVTGHLVPEARCCSVATLPALPDHIRAAAWTDDVDRAWIPLDAFTEDDGLALLLTMDPCEVAVRQVGDVARRLSDA